MNTSTLHSDLCYRLTYAQQQLLVPEVPLSLKATTYIRICCNAMVKHNQAIKAGDCEPILSGKTHTPYLNFLRRLALINSQWWTTCYVESDGTLASHDEYIHSLLIVLNAFVQSELSIQQAA
ncbi:MAG: hypothetical protein VKJ64_00975 [Leptolyngbyaceae bacterium]|nr:hypothetical protein [Leptolyngbyaceae bacterium]